MTDTFAGVPGAVLADGVLLHVGNPLVEQRLLVRGEAFAPLGDRAVLEVAGPDRLTWLDSLTSQAVSRLVPGESTELLVLDPQGHVEHAAAVLDDGASAWLIVDAPDAEALLGWLTRMRFRMRVELQIADDLVVIGSSAARASTLPAAAPAGVPLIWRDPWPGITEGGHGYFAGEHPGVDRDWCETLVSRADAAALAASAAADGAVAGTLAADALRVAAWRPRWRGEVDDRTLPHEVDWMRTAVHLSKGCYRGQETVAKVHNLGHPPRRLVAVQLDGSESILPEPGAAILVDGTAVGVLTSVARHYEEGPIGLGVIRRTAGDGDVQIEVDGGAVPAVITTIVPADAGASAQVPRMPRLSRRAAASPPPATAP